MIFVYARLHSIPVPVCPRDEHRLGDCLRQPQTRRPAGKKYPAWPARRQDTLEGVAMTNEQILQKAVEKAKASGWNMFDLHDIDEWWVVDEVLCIRYESESFLGHYSVNDVVFSHSFAKAFWGEQLRRIDCYDLPNFETEDPQGAHWYSLPAWQYHVQRLVLADEPLRYLEQFLTDKEVAGAV
jgi:hypothetical protein